MKDPQSQQGEASLVSGEGRFGVIVRGLTATMAFVCTALFLTVIGYFYGTLLDISPEFPLILTLPFIAGAAFLLLVFPLVGMIAGRAGFVKANSWVAMAAGAGFGAATMAIVWLAISRPGTEMFDWPESLYLMQLMLSGVAAGMALFSGPAGDVSGNPDLDDGRSPTTVKSAEKTITGITAGRRSRFILMTTLLFLLAMLLPFLPLREARRSFQEVAREQAVFYFRLPADFSMELTNESSGIGSIEKNVRYRVSGVQDEAGRPFSVEVIGNRNNYKIEVMEIHASLKVSTEDIPYRAEWNDTEAGRLTQRAILDLASARVNTPLKIVSVQDTGSTGKKIVMRGDGLEVVARPGEISSEAPGAYLTFTAASR